ncbi:MAG: 4-(cytidine 5'-diphospho)-2-C-methyl-D-erythritol kinase, partial [Burkholderiales bacterium]
MAVTHAGSPLVVAAPAKVNYFLHVTGRRADGYHTLESLFVLIDLADTLTLVPRDDGEIVRARAVAGVTEDDDLALRAAHALKRATKSRRGVSIGLVKRIPVGGGLGGGSSDAASVLLGLNRLWSLRLSRAALADIGVALGADVPFFIVGENAM